MLRQLPALLPPHGDQQSTHIVSPFADASRSRSAHHPTRRPRRPRPRAGSRRSSRASGTVGLSPRRGCAARSHIGARPAGQCHAPHLEQRLVDRTQHGTGPDDERAALFVGPPAHPARTRPTRPPHPPAPTVGGDPQRHGHRPTPTPHRPTWREFLTNQAHEIMAADFIATLRFPCLTATASTASPSTAASKPSRGTSSPAHHELPG